MVSSIGEVHTNRDRISSGIMAKWRSPPTKISAVSISDRAAGLSPDSPSSPIPITVSHFLVQVI